MRVALLFGGDKNVRCREESIIPERGRAFSLVELLVVIGIIAVLIGILLPTMMRIRQSSVTLTCLSNQRQLGQAFAQYANSNKGVLAYSYLDGSFGTYFQFWYGSLAQDGSTQWAVSGSLRKVGNVVTPPKLGEWGGTPIKCPNNSQWYAMGGFNGVSYAMMTYPVDTNGSFKTLYAPPKFYFNGCLLVHVRDPSNTVLAIDSASGLSAPLVYDNAYMPGITVQATGLFNRGGTVDRVWLAHPNNTVNILFIDCHAETCDAGWLKKASITNYFDNDGVVHP
ncbi:hypothetical protein BH10PLA1_BH10PLA1_22180 [soil metagenome]